MATMSKRETKLTWALIKVTFCYFLLVTPISVMNMMPLSAEQDHEYLKVVHLAFYAMYWLHFSINFLIYAASCQPYRKAYCYFLKSVKDSLTETRTSNRTIAQAVALAIVNHQRIPTILINGSIQGVESAFIESFKSLPAVNQSLEHFSIILVPRYFF